MRYGAVDIGTNSCRVLIADVNDEGLYTVYRNMETTRIGQGVNATGLIAPDAIERTIDCLERFAANLQLMQVKHSRWVATSAVREAANRKTFLDLAMSRANAAIDIVSGEEEANLSYLGVCRGLPFTASPLVVDLGGGSTEFIWQGLGSYVASIPIGAVRATEAQMSVGDMAAVVHQVNLSPDLVKEVPLVFVGGTATSLVAVKEGMDVYDKEKVHGKQLTRAEIADLYNMLQRMPLSLRRRLPGLQPERADIIPAGACLILLIMDYLGKDVLTVSESDILEGIVWSLYSQQNR